MIATGVLLIDAILNFLLSVLWCSLGLLVIALIALAVVFLIAGLGELYGNHSRRNNS